MSLKNVNASSSKVQFDEYVVRVPKITSKKYSVIKFNGSDCSDPQKWVNAEIKRDLSAKKVFQEEDDQPEFGAGSEYGRKQKQEARKLKYGMKVKKFDVESQPWKLKVTAPLPRDKEGKPVNREFIGRKEGGIGEGSMYFMFTQTPDFTFEAHPIDSWYSFKRTIAHRTLTDEEAEQMWDQRDKIVNHLNIMARKRLHIEDNEENEEEAKSSSMTSKSKTNSKGNNSFMIHDDEMLMSDSSDSSDDGEGTKKKKKKNKKDPEDKPVKQEALEDSDDGDGEGQEQDYNSDISSEEETVNEKRVAPKGLDELEISSSSSDEDVKSDEEDKNEKSKTQKGDSDKGNSSSESDIDSDMEKEGKALFMNKHKTPKKKGGSSGGSRSSTPVDMMMGTGTKLKEVAKKLEGTQAGRSSPSILGKRSAPNDDELTSNKRTKLGVGNRSGSNTPTKELGQQGITEEAVRRYLLHKPITSKDLVKKFKTKKTGLTNEQIGMALVVILKRLSPLQKKINNKLHFYLKE